LQQRERLLELACWNTVGQFMGNGALDDGPGERPVPSRADRPPSHRELALVERGEPLAKALLFGSICRGPGEQCQTDLSGRDHPKRSSEPGHLQSPEVRTKIRVGKRNASPAGGVPT